MEIRTTFEKCISPVDNLPLAVLRTEPVNPADAVDTVVIVHGMCEHKGRYEEFVRFLAQNGCIVTIFDLRGHGESVRDAGDLGYFYGGGVASLTEDLSAVVAMAENYTMSAVGRRLPVTIVAHSMGTLIARCWLREHDDVIDRLVLCGCPSKPTGMRPGLWFVRLLRRLRGSKARSRIVDVIVCGGYEKRFAKEKTIHAWINSDPAEVAVYNEDPLCGFSFTLDAYETLIRMTMLTYRDGGYKMSKPGLPIRFFSGADDPCAISEKKLGKAIALLRKQGYRDTKGKVYPGMRHEILRESAKTGVHRDILAFMRDGAGCAQQ